MDVLLVAKRHGVHVLTLNRPDRLNALTKELHARLADAFDAAGTDPGCRAVLLTGAGRAFCAGADLQESTPGGDLGESLELRYNPLIRRIRALPKPVVCAVQGVAAGAGCNLALACDIVLASHSARFLQAFIRIGLVPDAGGSWTLPRLVGEARARAMAMLGEPVTGEQAVAWGMAWRTMPDEDLAMEAEAMAARLAAQPTQALALMKRAFNASSSNTLDQQLDLERDLQRDAGRTPDHAEGVRAFFEKRPAVFTGRA